MTINDAIRTALSYYGHFEYPCYANTYTGKDDTYFVFNYNVVPDSYGDDEPEYARYIIQVHFYCPMTLDTVEIAKKVRLALEKMGFTYPEQVDASDEEGQHIVFECEGIEYIERT